MFSFDEQDQLVSCKSSAVLSSVDRIDAQFRLWVQQQDPEANWGPLGFILRELAINAIEHGSHSEITKNYECTLERLSEGRYLLSVEDEGAGFEFEKYRLVPPADPANPRNRGYAIINAYADEVQFENQGRKILAYVTLPTHLQWSIDDEENCRVLVPRGDLTADMAEAIRNTLLNWVESPLEGLEINLSNVKSIDSIILSVLVSLYHTIQSRAPQKKVYLTGSDPDLLNLFILTRLNRLFTISDKREAQQPNLAGNH